jgi:hypothetical protein
MTAAVNSERLVHLKPCVLIPPIVVQQKLGNWYDLGGIVLVLTLPPL